MLATCCHSRFTCILGSKQGLIEKVFQGVQRWTLGPQNWAKNLQITLKRSSLKFGPIFCPKLGEEQKKKDLHSILVQIFSPKSGEEQKKKVFHSNLVQIFPQNQVKSKRKEKKGLHSNLVQIFPQNCLRSIVRKTLYFSHCAFWLTSQSYTTATSSNTVTRVSHCNKLLSMSSLF